jgi:hypothetical protein
LNRESAARNRGEDWEDRVMGTVCPSCGGEYTDSPQHHITECLANLRRRLEALEEAQNETLP